MAFCFFMVLRDQIDVAKSHTPKKVDLQKLPLIHVHVARSRPSQLWAGRRADVPTGNVATNKWVQTRIRAHI